MLLKSNVIIFFPIAVYRTKMGTSHGRYVSLNCINIPVIFNLFVGSRTCIFSEVLGTVVETLMIRTATHPLYKIYTTEFIQKGHVARMGEMRHAYNILGRKT
jgi:hypothetical protein